MKLSKIDDKLSVYKDKKVIIWGTGSAGRKMLHMLIAGGVEVTGFCDSNTKKQGTLYCGYAIFSPEYLKKHKGEVLIQIASVYELEIENNLLELGICNYILYSEAKLRLKMLKKYQFTKKHPQIVEYYLNEVDSSRYSDDRMRYITWDLLLDMGIDYSKELIFACMPPKTGDFTIANTLEKYGVCGINLWHTSSVMNSYVKQLIKGRTIKIITAVREPIAQNLSQVFQIVQDTGKYGWWLHKECWEDGGDVSAIFEKYVQDERTMFEDGVEKRDIWRLPYPCLVQLYFQSEFEKKQGFNIYDYPFDKEKGYSIIKLPEAEIFVYQLERLNDIQGKLFEFLGVENGELVNGNEAKDKWYYECYTKAKKEIKFSREYFEWCYNSEYTKHFYSEKDIEKYKVQWEKNIRD